MTFSTATTRPQWHLRGSIFVLVAFASTTSGSGQTSTPPRHRIPTSTRPPAPARFLFALDLDGKPHNIGDGDGYKAMAVVFLATDCPVSREYVPTLIAWRRRWPISR